MDPTTVPFKIMACALVPTVCVLGLFLPRFYPQSSFFAAGVSQYNCLLSGIILAAALTQMLAMALSLGALSPWNITLLTALGFVVSMAMHWPAEAARRPDRTHIAYVAMANAESQYGEDGTGNWSIEQGYQPRRIQPSVLFMTALASVEIAMISLGIGIQPDSAGVMVVLLAAAALSWRECVTLALVIARETSQARLAVTTIGGDTTSGTVRINVDSYKRHASKQAALCAILLTVLADLCIGSVTLLDAPAMAQCAVLALIAGFMLFLQCEIITRQIHEERLDGPYPDRNKVISGIGQTVVGVAGVVLLEFVL